MKQVIDYTMTAEYRKEWHVVDAIREIVQNCLDNRDCASLFHINEEDGYVVVETHGYILPKSALALGSSMKPDGAIGGFGEGFKLAMLVLARNGCEPVARSGNSVYRPVFNYNGALDVDTFCIEVEDVDDYHHGLEYTMTIDPSLVAEVREKINVFSSEVMPEPENDSVALLEDRPGSVYVCGLYVCHEDKFKFGYNFSASMLKLGCDRQVANSFGMAWETSKAWAQMLNEENAGLVLDMMNDGILDVQDIQYFITPAGSKLIAAEFAKRNGNVAIKPINFPVRSGMAVMSSVFNVLTKSGQYTLAKDAVKKPCDILQKFLTENKKHMRSKARRQLLKLIDESKAWSDIPF